MTKNDQKWSPNGVLKGGSAKALFAIFEPRATTGDPQGSQRSPRRPQEASKSQFGPILAPIFTHFRCILAPVFTIFRSNFHTQTCQSTRAFLGSAQEANSPQSKRAILSSAIICSPRPTNMPEYFLGSAQEANSPQSKRAILSSAISCSPRPTNMPEYKGIPRFRARGQRES